MEGERFDLIFLPPCDLPYPKVVRSGVVPILIKVLQVDKHGG